ncbi:dual adapter for phosphotyrosine and 3-phosphotyrosine and 3-phosphoinositide-like [Xenia sp. Carnegie-2017]|uniref:dual adapter for phosphotyrosine and 3-phosphotyrosine and 3-phosphoinositide-like n=1 Tax=Xenia sp. Carnegie-2017 TaxID=2897299 RepID=UPI001F03AE95|nr:dual adapter for phosphotyrosine and 3-phosphotyrosine and 3-phosphoinositide-like [Xenia sp. Carnegie-2017]
MSFSGSDGYRDRMESDSSSQDSQLDPEEEYVNCSMERLPCFYHASSRETSEILLQNSDEGSYLIRSGSEAGHYTVSVRASDSVRHFKIECHGESYSFGQAYFWSPVDVWEHLKEQPVLEVGEGIRVQLLQPYKSKPSNRPEYSSIFRHYVPSRQILADENSEPTKKRVSRTGSTTTSKITSWEGELRKKKEGKTWKRRWCILKDHYFMYKKNENALKTLKKLDLTDAIQIDDNYSEANGKKDNFFRIIFPDVYFVFYHENDELKKTWVENLKQKIEESKHMAKLHEINGGD